MAPVILAGDVGGTNTRLALYETEGGRLRSVVEARFESRRHGSLDEIVREFAMRLPERPRAAGFGIAGPVCDGRCEATNLPWVVEAGTLSATLSGVPCTVLNDLEALAAGIAELGPGALAVLNEGGRAPGGNRCVIAAGTGLGEAGLIRDSRAPGGFRPVATEGGHADFAPSSDVEVELWRFARAALQRAGAGDHVSVERLVSGPGLVTIARFVREGAGQADAALEEALRAEEPAAAISAAALEKRSPRASRALELFVSLYGAEAGNLALKYLATGGVYVGGGIAPKILPALEGGFLRAFTAKGRFRPLLEEIPVRVVLDDRAGLLGAALAAGARSAPASGAG